MSLKIGIVGLPNVGKSTLFAALTKNQVDIANYPFCTIDPNVGVVEVADERVRKLAALSHSKKTIPAVVEFVDIAGLVKGAAEGEGLGNAFLSNIREVDAIAEVVRVFEDSDVIHVSGVTDPVSDIDIVEYELVLKDLETVSKRIESTEKRARAREQGAEEELAILSAIKEGMLRGEKANSFFEAERASQAAERLRHELSLLSSKPFIYVFNASEEQIKNKWVPGREIIDRIERAPYIVLSAKTEAELVGFSDEDRRSILEELDIAESGLDALVHTGYRTLGLISFFTTGEDETRAWTIPAGSTAPRAGRAIHSDFEEKFIRAEIIHWEKLVEAGSWARSRELGTLRIEGKEYVVQDGDVIEFRI